MIKKYLTTPEEILALRHTDTKIYKENNRGYYKFVGGVPCFFGHDSTVFYNATIDFDQVESKLYILVEEPIKEATEKDAGKLCKFIRKDGERISILACFTNNKRPVAVGGDIFDKCYRLTPAEVAEITGYKVEG